MRVLDAFLTAGTLVEMFGLKGATLAATCRADTLMAQGDTEGHQAWKQVMSVLYELERSGPAVVQPMN